MVPVRKWGTQMFRYRQSSLPLVSLIKRFTWRHLFLYSVVFMIPSEKKKRRRFKFVGEVLVLLSVLLFIYLFDSLTEPTVPARVTLWFLKPSREVSERNPSEDVHVMAVTQTNVLTLDHPSLGVDHPELQTSTNRCQVCFIFSFSVGGEMKDIWGLTHRWPWNCLQKDGYRHQTPQHHHHCDQSVATRRMVVQSLIKHLVMWPGGTEGVYLLFPLLHKSTSHLFSTNHITAPSQTSNRCSRFSMKVNWSQGV